jgi:Domain of unknown function (DUF3598)
MFNNASDRQLDNLSFGFLDRETCNQPDGVVHPAMTLMRSRLFEAGATAWVSPRFMPGKPFGVGLFLARLQLAVECCDRLWRKCSS